MNLKDTILSYNHDTYPIKGRTDEQVIYDILNLLIRCPYRGCELNDIKAIAPTNNISQLEKRELISPRIEYVPIDETLRQRVKHYTITSKGETYLRAREWSREKN